MTKKIFKSIVITSMVVLIASIFIANSFLYDFFNKAQVSRLKEELSIVANNVEKFGDEYFDNFDSTMFRLTLIANDGVVLYDSQTDATLMENHLDREEVVEAIDTGNGSSARHSETLGRKTYYEAKLLKNGNVIRISVDQITLGALIFGMLSPVFSIILVALILAFILANKMSESIVKPLNELDVENLLEGETYDELSPMVNKIIKQQDKITRQMQELNQKADEFEQITESMSEGLVLLNKEGVVISINDAAKKLFNVGDDAVGSDFLIIDRNLEMNNAIQKALKGKHSELREKRNGNEYQFIINRIESEGKTAGVVILSFDITGKAFAERSRREFTANVSHELKTPLQSIIGSAELLENGLVKQEDIKKFVGNIKDEASRLVSLINDIIDLSQLDENIELEKEMIMLNQVVEEVVEDLSMFAKQKEVEIEVDSEPCEMKGIRRYLYEIVYNLCDNAIRYSEKGGRVTVKLKNKNGNIVLVVSDEGIGISPEHQSRIFERFYRVDKSHSKETGGTGLGLAIVKNAVAYHDGTIKIDSNIKKGTTITIQF
ncbi:MAG: ATP-binding protein [Bacillota bacterium]|jgi:two-component system phosphate regulon sensor histidine kinase PhoR|nr:ATP-binding protein [Bacillota bacterium]NLL26238.1 PAS domain-containing protein [Erysipelotrichia bacterium]